MSLVTDSLSVLEERIHRLTIDLSTNSEPQDTALRRLPPRLPTPIVPGPEFLATWQATLTKGGRKLGRLLLGELQKQLMAIKKDLAKDKQSAYSYIDSIASEEEKKKAHTLFPKLVEGQARRVASRGAPARKRRF